MLKIISLPVCRRWCENSLLPEWIIVVKSKVNKKVRELSDCVLFS